MSEAERIRVMIVDDIVDTRDQLEKLLFFEKDIEVIAKASNGREAVAMAKQLRPDVVLMDINMPDMDGIQATTLITEAIPTTAVIMMSVQNDPDYLRRAMLAGARNFLPKPVSMDELYNTIRTVHARNKPLAAQYAALATGAPIMPKTPVGGLVGEEERAGHIVVVYSPQGGVGCTTIATNLASALMKEGVRVLLVDADMQFGDVGVLLNLQAQTTIVDLAGSVDDLDVDLFDNIVITHDSGLKVLMGPARPEMADVIHQNPKMVATILEKVAMRYDYVIVDTACHLDETLLSLFDIASKVVLVTTPTLAGVKNIRFVLDLFDQMGYEADRAMLVLNRVPVDRNQQKLMIPTERIEKFLKRPVDAQIPADDITALNAMSKGVLMVAQRDRSRSPVKEMMLLADLISTRLMGTGDVALDAAPDQKKSSFLRFGKS